MNMRILIGLSLLCVSLLQVQVSWAASYSLPAASFPPCTGSWSQANNTCNNKIILAAGDTVEASGNLIIKADAGIELKGSNRLGSNSANVSLASTYGDLLIGTGSQIYGSLSATSGDIVVSAGGNVSGSVSADGALRLTGAWVGGTVSGSGNGTLADSEVVGNVSISNSLTATNSRFGANVSSTGTVSLTLGQSVAGNIVGRNIVLSGMTVGGTVTGNGSGSFSDTTVVGNVSLQNGLGANNAVLHGTLTSTNGAVTFNGGSIAGLMNVGCCQVTVSGGATISNGIRAGNNGITISNSTVTGDLSAGSNPIKLTNVAMLSGNISAGGNDVTITGGTLNANVTDANNVKLYGDTNFTGNLQARYTVAVTDSTLAGNIFGSSGYTLQRVYLYAASEVYGDVTVGTTWQTIEGDDQSRIYGVCTYGKVNPPSLCEGGPPKVVHHYELSYASQALTCQPHRVELKACVDEACSGTYSAGQSSVTLSPAGWVGSSTVSFIGSKELSLAIRSPGSVTLGIANPSPVASGSPALRCRINGVLSNQCALTFADSGLLVSVPPLIAGKSDTLTISAVRKSDNSPACIPVFANVTRPVQLWGSYIDPGPTEQKGNKLIQVEEQPVGSTPVTRSLAFNANGQAQSSVRYDDAGKMQLDARYQGDASRGDAGLVMEGNTQFISRPVGLCVRPLEGACEAGSDCPKLRTVGEPLDFEIYPVAYEQDNDSDFCAGNAVTRNYRQSGLQLEPRVVAPAAGMNGRLLQPADGRYDHLPPAGGESGWDAVVRQSVAFSEVGTFRLRVEPPPSQYLGKVTVPAAESVAVGRIVPAFLRVAGDIRVQPSCGTFSYQDQPMTFEGDGPLLTFSAWGRDSDGKEYLTLNYDRDGFWKLAAPAHSYSSVDPAGSAVNRLESMGTPAPLWLNESGVDNPGDGLRRLRIGGEMLVYRRAAMPSAEDQPFPLNAWLVLENTALTDSDGVCASEEGSGCMDRTLSFSAGELRLGRVFSENAIAPEIPLAGMDAPQLLLPVRIEHWNGTTYQAVSDTCTQIVEHERIISGNLSEIEVGERTSLGFPVKALQGQDDRLDGSAALRFALSSTVDGAEIPAKWLCVKLPENAGVANGGVCGYAAPTVEKPVLTVESGASATFGIYQGPQPLIFRRELYR